MLKISALYIYPVKSLAGIAVSEARITAKGFEHDRRWMLVDENNRFMSQREFAIMALLQPELTRDGLKITYRVDGDSVLIPYKLQAGSRKLTVTVWDDTCLAARVGDEADAWFSRILGTCCKLVFMPDDTIRQVEKEYAPVGAVTSFSDAYPFLLVGQSSLDDLNHRLANPVPINRFRPNMVFEGGAPFAEDGFDSFTIGDNHFNGVKLCARCQVITINQQDASKGKEPSKTLTAYRLRNNKIYFGQNLLGPADGRVNLGDELIVIKYHTNERFKIAIATELPVTHSGK